ncbi:MAG TPA: two-component system response regulator [Candidatus Omnitrophica bacterium]|nr:two-component system response regulator [Candidatus Omnitrophota bacterium]
MEKKILVVDDEPKIVQVITSRLKANHYETCAAFDGMQAVHLAHEQKPDLIILDIRMPAGGGMSVYKNLKMSSDTATIPIIFLTADASPETREKVLEMGAEGFITKPFDSEDLMKKVNDILGEGA